MNRKTLTFAIAALTALSLAACGDKESSDSASGSESAASGSADSMSAEGTSTGGSYTASIDGEALTLADEAVVCASSGGAMNIAVGPSNPGADAEGIAAVVADDGTVTAVTMGAPGGRALVFAPEAGQGEATATIDGKTYEITGQGMVTDMSNPGMPETKPFELKVTCE